MSLKPFYDSYDEDSLNKPYVMYTAEDRLCLKIEQYTYANAGIKHEK